ncbi:hypothetical protein DSO57_1027670 [Entomophthora muscae]|uniref:Uncharacterized protein n=1 Tax=Entomophthora muscae TaxID=34485 RepID=A0ACC2RGB7_9FUNG|nr:hypothetical protein DSO57_1027670 [Entomophthora muscae]
MPEKTRVHPPTDVGYAWIIVVASFVMQGCAIGVISSFGVFMEHYCNQVFVNEEKSRVAMIVNIAPVVLGLFSAVAGRICQRFGVQVCVVVGAVVMMAGHVLASFGTEIWHFALTQGALIGIGSAFIYVPANVAITEWFEKRRGLAAGLAAAGGGIGGVAFGQLNTQLLHALELRVTLQINGVIVLVVLLLSAALVRRRESHVAAGAEDMGFSSSLVFNGKFGWFAVSAFFGGCAYFIPLYFVNSHVVSLGMTRREAGYAGSAINIGSSVGRVGLGLLADHIGYMRCYLLTIALTAATTVLWRVSTTFGMFVVFGVLYGIPSGGYAGSFGPICGTIFGRRQLATMMGLINAFVGVGDLIGPVVAGLLIDNCQGYHPTIYFTVACYTAAFVAMAIASCYPKSS